MKYYDPNLGYIPFKGGYLGNIFFFVLGGFLLMQHFEQVTPPEVDLKNMLLNI